MVRGDVQPRRRKRRSKDAGVKVLTPRSIPGLDNNGETVLTAGEETRGMRQARPARGL